MNDVSAQATPAIESVVTLTVDGHEYLLVLPDSQTDHIQLRIREDHRPYEYEMLADMASRVAHDTLVLDVGANVGNHTMYLAAVAGCRVEAFEPNVSLCDALTMSASLNSLSDRINVHRTGVGIGNGWARFAEALPSNLGAQKLDVGKGDIPIVALDDMHFQSAVGMIKIDVEGMELDVLNGAKALLRRDRPLVYVECLTEKEFWAVGKLLESQGYSHWDTFNVSPTHLFRPGETLSTDDRLSRLTMSSVLESYRSSQVLSTLRQKLTRAYANERQSTAALAVAQSRETQLQTKIDALTAQGTELRARVSEFESLLRHARADLSEARADMQARTAQLEDAQRDSAAQRSAHDQAAAALGDLRKKTDAEDAAWKQERQRLTLHLANQERQIQFLQQDQARLKAMARRRADRIHELDAALSGIHDSVSFRTGAALVAASRSLPDAAKLPVRLWRIYSGAVKRRRSGQSALASEAPRYDAEIDATGASQPLASMRQDAAVRSATLAAQAPRPVVQAAVLAPVTDTSRLKIACVVDDFTFHSFAPDCKLLALSAPAWQSEIAAFEPDFVLVESAWRGVDGSWARKVSDMSPELMQLVAWCRERSVPTALWCKEDPVHFARFLPVARLVDHVFTTDIDCIAKYKDALRHHRVHLLPFAAQPKLHNPIQTVEREQGFCFAGSYYPHYADRQINFATLATVARRLATLTIFDRNADRPQPHDFQFPAEYAGEIKGSLPYHEIDRAYKGYRFGITVNTIKQSQSMFARRAFELLACNTIVVSNFSRGLRLFFGDLVVSSDSEAELEHRLRPLAQDFQRQRRHRQLALRKTLSQHTYAHRLAYMAQMLSGRPVAHTPVKVLAVAMPADAQSRDDVIASFERQALATAALALVTALPRPDGCSTQVTFVPDIGALETLLQGFDYVAPLSPNDHHGPHYLSDLALAVQFAPHDVLTKAAHYAVDESGDVQLLHDGQQYKPAESALARSSLIKTQVVLRDLADGMPDIDRWTLQTPSILAVDEFEYCRNARHAAERFEASSVSADLPLFQGLDLPADLLPMAEKIAPPERVAQDEGPITLSPAALLKLFPSPLDPRLEATWVEEGILLRSKLGPDEHQYVYLTRRFSVAELHATEERFFQLEADARVDLRTVLVFMNAADQKISYAMHSAGARYAFTAPPGTASVRFALRIQGGGHANLGSLTLAETRDFPVQVLPTARDLLVTNQYPSYSDLYRFGFVHARIGAYRRAGVPVDVLKVSVDPKIRFREFEDVNVVEGDVVHLDACLQSGQYESVLIHIIDQKIWSTIREHLDRARVVIWAHGAEIQPWWRRAMNFPTDGLRDQARRTSDTRLAMWREILSLRHPNLRVVFISRKQADEAMSDLRLDMTSMNPVVIPNYINGDLFAYAAKPPEQRRRILSIRPYASHIYANDLMVQAVLKLAERPFFSELSFRIVGDGRLFEETVAPLRHLPNVELTQAFLTQRQIAALHKDHGVFLVPSRMDTQGVSRDEAMASGLVPITTRIAAIPEFVDETCAFLAPPEDANALADAIERLHHDGELFQRMSAAAAKRVRKQSGYAATIERELAIIAGVAAEEQPGAATAQPTRIALYGDLNLNIMDGSAVWAASLAETLCGIDGVRVTFLLKTRIQRTQVLGRLLDLAPSVQIVEPSIEERSALKVEEAIAELAALDATYRFRCFILRGLDLCAQAAQTSVLQGRIWAYLTDIPQSADMMDAATHSRITRIVAASECVLCQTPQMRDHFNEQFPDARGKTRILSPMIPPAPVRPIAGTAGPAFRMAYAGKFAPNWGIREMFAAFAALRDVRPDAELHVFGDKIHNPGDDPSFRDSTVEALSSTPGLSWHGAVDRDQLMRELTGMNACWAFRDPGFERSTLELSTKVLEYASLGVPPILTRSPVNEDLLGADYPLFVDDATQGTEILLALAKNPALASEVRSRLQFVAGRYSFEAVRDRLGADEFLARPLTRPAAEQ
jgi:FkbM family methyltransferase